MRRLAFAFLTLSVALVAGCQDASLPTFVDQFDVPLLDIVDGAHGDDGNVDFFFFPPIAPLPIDDPGFEADEFNPNLSPLVQICDPATCPEDPVLEEPAELRRKTRKQLQQYGINWKTERSDRGRVLRIRVLVGKTVLGFADVQLVTTIRERMTVPEGTFPVLAGSRVPIRFWIENGALCSPPGTDPCASTTVDLGEGATIALNTGDRIDIPAQEGREGEEVTVTMQGCADFDNLPIDLPTFGACLDITADPMLIGERVLEDPAIVSVCSQFVTGLDDMQEPLVTLHQFDLVDDEAVVMALPHTADFCDAPVPAPGSSAGLPINLVRDGWRIVRDGLTALVNPEPLSATTALLDQGNGGSTGTFGSSFQLALPAQMDFVSEDDESRFAAPGGTLPAKVDVTDRNGDPVEGATVTFTIIEGNGSVGSIQTVVVTGPDGRAEASWTLDDEPGSNALTASGFGIADPLDDGPFMPDISLPTDEQTAVFLETGEIVFSATGTNFVVEQGDFTAAVSALDGATDVVSFYGYNTEFVASANTGLEKSNTSILFIYRDENGIVSLVMIHDITNDESGGKAVFEFSGVPDGTDFVVRDDGGASEAVLPVSTWLWADCCTDGGALNGSLGQAFAMTIVPDFPEEGGLTEGKIDAWTFLTGVLENPTSIDLDLTTAVTIRRLTP